MSRTILSAIITFLFAVSSSTWAAGQGKGIDTSEKEFKLTDTNGDGAVDVEEYRARVLVIFSALDKDGDGFLVIADVPDDRKDVYGVVDEDGNGRVTLREYMLYVMPRFWMSDYDGDNTLSKAEVKAADEQESEL